MKPSFLAFVLAAMLVPRPVAAAVQRQIIGAEQNHALAEANDCAHFYKTTFTTFRSQQHEQEQREFFLPDRKLRIVASHEGGVSIRGWNRRYTRMIVCRYAVADSLTRAQQVLNSVSISSTGGEVLAAGPAIDDSQAWWVNMIVYVPRRTTIDISSTNGGIAIRNMTGRVTARATSGGISLAQSTGEVRISTESGGISLERVGGSVDATSRDGMIALKVERDEIPSLEARTDGQSHILCTLAGCGEGAPAWSSGGKQLRLGPGIPGIRMKTSAPIVIAPVAY